MLDFPASPTNGQLFTGANGVVYQWNAVGGLWLVYGVGTNSGIVGDTPPSNPVAGQLWFNSALGQLFVWYTDPNSSQWVPANPSTAATAGTTPGDFFATATITSWTATLTTPTTLVVQSGNSGGWFVPATGRYTPPAGRYVLYGGFEGGNTGAATLNVIVPRKNGTQIISSHAAVSTANYLGAATFTITVDANGTDWFDWQANSTSNVNMGGYIWFGAFPIGTVVYTTTGPAWRQLGRVIPTAGQATVDFTAIPSDINDLELRFDVIPTATPNAQLYFRVFDGSGVISAGVSYGYSGQYNYTTQTTGASALVWNAGISGLSTGIPLAAGGDVHLTNGIAGIIRVPNIRDAARVKRFFFEVSQSTNVPNNYHWSGMGYWQTAAMTGVRLTFTATTFAAGGAVTLWGSP